MKTVLVAGSSRPLDKIAYRAARMVALTLVDHDFNLVTGNAPGVDRAAAKSFCFELERRHQDVATRYTQVALPAFRSSWWPWPRYRPSTQESIRSVRRADDWLEAARAVADAAVIVGGHGGSKGIADRFIDVGKPVFPVPFTSGCSDDLFREVLRNWCDNPVPGLSKAQFLRLAVPWISGTGALGDLLLGTLSPTPDIFISYRRADSEWIAARLRADLAEQFGTRRVFFDSAHIRPGEVWSDVIARAVRAARVGVVLIGGSWLGSRSGGPADNRIQHDDDVLRREIRELLGGGKHIIVVMTPDAPAPETWQLPDDIVPLRQIQAIGLSPATWEIAIDQIVRTIRPLLQPRPPINEPPTQPL